MPEGDTTIAVVFSDVYTLTISDDHGNSGASTYRDSHSFSTTVINQYSPYITTGDIIFLNEPSNVDTGFVWKGWEIESGGVQVGDVSHIVTVIESGQNAGSQQKIEKHGTGFTVGNSDIVVKAVYEEATYSITICDYVGGTVTASKPSAKAGEQVQITVTPNSGYQLVSLTFEPSLTITDGFITMPSSDVSVTATFGSTGELQHVISNMGGNVLVEIDVPQGLGSNLSNPMLLTIGKYSIDNKNIVINSYSKVSDGTAHKEYVALSPLNLTEIWVHLVDGISAQTTTYFVHITSEELNQLSQG